MTREIKHAGLEIQWLDCTPASCPDDANAVSVDIRVSRKVNQGSGDRGFPAFGVTVERRIIVFHDKVRDFALWCGVPEAEVLALVLMHELGHALLGPGHLPGDALMMARPTLNHVRLFSAGQLRFTPKQMELIQAAARAR